MPDADPINAEHDDHRSWQARLVFERTTASDRAAMIEGILTELGEERILQAIEYKLAARQRTFTPAPPHDR